MCISNKFPGNAEAAGVGATLRTRVSGWETGLEAGHPGCRLGWTICAVSVKSLKLLFSVDSFAKWKP